MTISPFPGTRAPHCATCNRTICDHTDTEWNSASRTPEAADDGRANPRGAPVNAGGEGGARDHGSDF